MRILVVKTSSMGDLVHCLPAVSDIARCVPGAVIDWLAEETFVDIARLHPSVQTVITCAMRRWRTSMLDRAVWREFAMVRRSIREKDYDVTIDFQGLLKSACWSKVSAGISHGYDRRSAREPLASLLYDVRHTVAPDRHAVLRNRLLAASVFGYQVDQDLLDFGLVEKPTRARQLVFLHGSSRTDKCLATHHWQELASMFVDAGFDLLLPWHGKVEKTCAEAIASVGGRLLDAMSVGQLAEILAESQLVIGVDSGLVHLAAALATPTVALYVSTDPSLVGVCGNRTMNLSTTAPANEHPAVHLVVDSLDDMTRVYDHALSLVQVVR